MTFKQILEIRPILNLKPDTEFFKEQMHVAIPLSAHTVKPKSELLCPKSIESVVTFLVN